MKQLTDEELYKIWNAGMTFKELVQNAYEHGYQDATKKIKNIESNNNLDDNLIANDLY